MPANPLGAPLPHARLRGGGAAGATGGPASPQRAARHQWPFDGGAWRPGLCPASPRPLPLRFSFCTDCSSELLPLGEKAFSRYLGPDRTHWSSWDACELIASAPERLPLLIDQGLDDPFLESQLRPDDLEAAAQAAGHPLQLRLQPGYDHSYFFIASFIEDHLRHHAAALIPLG